MRSRLAKWSVLALVVVAAVGLALRARPKTIRPGDYLEVEATGMLLDQPVAGVHRVDEDGKITLGPAYGRVAVVGLDVDAATQAVIKHLKRTVKEPEVSVERLGGDIAPWLEAENRRLAAENLRLRTMPRGVTSNDR